MSTERLSTQDYTVGWICALPLELAAAKQLLDSKHDNHFSNDDDYLYTLGCINTHNIVIACLPAGRADNISAATVARWMRSKFTKIRFGLMVGIGGGVPSTREDVRLGDVVVSQPSGPYGGVVQYDRGRATPKGFQRTGSLNAPPQLLLNALSEMQALEFNNEINLQSHLEMIANLKFRREKAGPDVLFKPTYDHPEELKEKRSCEGCDTNQKEKREERDSTEVKVHYGTIASGGLVVKSARERNRASSDLGGVLCFETEAAGLMNNFPCLVIRGISDYADSHKNDLWQPYAAATAAVYAKALLYVIPSDKVVTLPNAPDLLEAENSHVHLGQVNPRVQQALPQQHAELPSTSLILRSSGQRSVHTPPQSPNLFNMLGADVKYISKNEKYWRRLTLESYKTYEQIYNNCKGANGLVSFNEYCQQFEPGGPGVARIRSVWQRLRHDEHTPDDAIPYPKPYILAITYMLHVEKYGSQIPNFEVGQPGKIERKRLNLLSNFDKWIECQCSTSCQIQWNFANTDGIYRGINSKCKVVELFKDLHWWGTFILKGSKKHIGLLKGMRKEWAQ